MEKQTKTNDNLPEILQESECESRDQISFRSHMLHLPQGSSSFQRRIRELSLLILPSGLQILLQVNTQYTKNIRIEPTKFLDLKLH